MNKICTSIKDSKRLIELGIDIHTADMHYMYRHWEIDENTIGSQSDASIGFDSDFYYGADNGKIYHYIPAWSFTALLKLIPNYQMQTQDNGIGILYGCKEEIKIIEGETPIDAAFEMVVWLKENNKL